MRGMLAALLAVALLAAPSFGVIIVTLVVDNPTLYVGQETQVRVLAQGSVGGLASLAGDIVAGGEPGILESLAGTFAFVPEFQSWGGTASAYAPALGAPGTNGGWSDFGSMQTALPMSGDYARQAAVEIARYTVRALAEGEVAVNFASQEVGIFLPAEVNHSTTEGVHVGAGVTVLVVPEPATLGLLALATIAALRRRR